MSRLITLLYFAACLYNQYRFGMQVQNLFAQVMEYTLRHATRFFWISSVHDLWFGEAVQVRAFGAIFATTSS